ncbi:ABC transporter substrate-binding protein [Frankia sp. CNm7]|uniref:ABC transporter substrate-binding protein n=1 Tax=Frankia nepalensis TaxID=1836974 RepID=A0A937UMT1_9ACTN|nr:ABC transporter substrate-binding protein [Frankia nepalensis]MBL7502686.1 ABC transporter substrate-binding protein [Frankia nepalensis]MBL7515031.1 ABC transporter substrate-binding protein [Frankia nepalensis]MBL7518720.1 ABC transporter substrate-binding protein [Frankia nepalensis]MBL7629159.1 ABC transporter substrate-binding protein [Frankia nepalensis]
MAALTCLLPACGGSSGDAPETPPSARPEAAVRTGGEATYLMVSEARNLEPASQINQGSAGGPLMNAIFDALFTVDPTSGDIQPRIAASFATTDGRTWTLKLRDGVKFSDGTALDAEAVRFSWERLRNGDVKGAVASDAVRQMDTITIVDPLTLTVTLKAPNWQFKYSVQEGATVWIVSPTAVRAQGADAFAQHPVGAGPFILKSRTPNAQTVLVRNPNYWQTGLPKLDTLILRPNPDRDQALDSIVTGQAQATYDGVGQLAQRAQAEGLNVQSAYGMQGGVVFLFNQAKAPFDDVRVRRAVALALNLDEIDQQVFEGAAEVPKTLFSNSSPFYDASLTIPSNQPEQAKALFDELAAEGKPVSFTISASTNTVTSTYAKAIQTQLSTYGNVKVEVLVADSATLVRAQQNHDFQMMNAGYASVDPEPALYAGLQSTGSNNYGSVKDPAIDEGLDAGRTASDQESRRAGYLSFQKAVIANVPAVWTHRLQAITIQADTVAGLRLYGPSSPLFDGFGLIE